MREADADMVFPLEGAGQRFRTIDGAVLAAGTAETDLQVAESPGDVTLDVREDERLDGSHEFLHLAVLFQECDHVQVASGRVLEAVVFPGIVHAAAVEDVAAAVAGLVLRDPFLVGETVDVHFQGVGFQRRRILGGYSR